MISGDIFHQQKQLLQWEETGKKEGSVEQGGSGTQILGLPEHLAKDLLMRMRGPAFQICGLQVA